MGDLFAFFARWFLGTGFNLFQISNCLYYLNLNKMDSDDDDGFPKQGGEALEIGDEFDDSEEELDDEPAPQMRKPMAGMHPASQPKKGPSDGAKVGG